MGISLNTLPQSSPLQKTLGAVTNPIKSGLSGDLLNGIKRLAGALAQAVEGVTSLLSKFGGLKNIAAKAMNSLKNPGTIAGSVSKGAAPKAGKPAASDLASAPPVSQGGADPQAKILGTGHAFPVKGGKIIGKPHSGTHTIGNWQSDNALDIAAPEGTPIYAPADGVVSLAKGNNNDPKSRFNGFNFELTNGDNQWYLTHLSEMLVKNGDHVKRGQLVGFVGSANGVPHLHIGQKNGNPAKTFAA